MKTKADAKLIAKNIFQTKEINKQKEEFNRHYEKYINFCEKRFVIAA